MSPAATFELLRFEARPVTPAVAVVELDGAFAGFEPVRPRLLVETGGVAHEMPALDEGGDPWSASFAVPVAALADRDATFALVPGRGPLIELPPPSEGGDADDDRFVALARTANDLRHRLADALERAADRDELAAELETLREGLAAAEERVADAHEAAVKAREEQARAEGEADEAREALTRAREEARTEVRDEIETAQSDAEEARRQLTEAQERAIAAEDEARAARLDLRDARARIEALVREARTARSAAAAARTRVPTATPRVSADDDAEFRAARLGPDWAEGSEDEGDEVEQAADDADDDDTAPLPVDDDADDDEDDTAPLPATASEPAPGDAPTTAQLAPLASPGDEDDAEADGPSLWRDDEGTESVRVLRPRTRAGRRRPAPPVIVDDASDNGDDDDVLQPAAVGARLIRPAETSRHRRALAIATHPRAIVGGIFLLLIAALVLIFSGAGPV